MTPSRHLVAASSFGASGGRRFDDTPPVDVLPDAAITKLVIGYSGSSITGVEAHYATAHRPTVCRGHFYNGSKAFELKASEYVTMIQGSLRAGAIAHMAFVTNKRILGEVGTVPKDPTMVVWGVADKVPSHLAHRMGLVSFAGCTTDEVLYSLQPVFAEYPCEEISAKYESVSTPPKDIQFHGSSPARNPTLLPTFALRLIAPTVILYAGPERTKYHASEATLCKLPFFQACLQGHFKEAADKTVALPDDDTDSIAALLEFLYTGGYTYCYDTSLTANAEGGILGIPIHDLRQALFHLNVYTTACKYDCASLAAAAIQNLRIVTRGLGAGDFLQVCVALYRDGLRVADLKEGEEKAVFKEKVMRWVKELCMEQREELVKATGKWPELACDLLGFATGAEESRLIEPISDI